jgi:hypothetical protein
MENLNWQFILVLFSVAVASCYLLQNAIQFLSGTSSLGCNGGGCDGCASGDVSQTGEEGSQFVSLDSLSQSSLPKPSPVNLIPTNSSKKEPSQKISSLHKDV